MAEWSKALASGASPQGRGFEPHSCHLSDAGNRMKTTVHELRSHEGSKRKAGTKKIEVACHDEPEMKGGARFHSKKNNLRAPALRTCEREACSAAGYCPGQQNSNATLQADPGVTLSHGLRTRAIATRRFLRREANRNTATRGSFRQKCATMRRKSALRAWGRANCLSCAARAPADQPETKNS